MFNTSIFQSFCFVHFNTNSTRLLELQPDQLYETVRVLTNELLHSDENY